MSNRGKSCKLMGKFNNWGLTMGGVLIGLSVLLMAFNGRIMGISGIAGAAYLLRG